MRQLTAPFNKIVVGPHGVENELNNALELLLYPDVRGQIRGGGSRLVEPEVAAFMVGASTSGL